MFDSSIKGIPAGFARRGLIRTSEKDGNGK